MEASTIPQISHGIMDEEDDGELGCTSSSSSSGDSTNSNDSSEFMDDATSSSSSSSSTPPPSLQHQQGALYEMSSLMAQLPVKRGLSKHFQGKSQSFTSLSNVKCLEDLAKPEQPHRKRMKSCRSYGGGLVDAHTQKPGSPRGCCSRAISKKPSRGGALSLSSPRRQGFLQGGSRPPMPPHRSSSSFCAQSILFA